jgi:hypothetical protein
MITPTATRHALLNAGFSPIPVEGKRPPLKEWQKKSEASATEIESWERSFPAATNTGILTARTPCIDIDLLVPEAAEAIEELARAKFAARGEVLVRFGRAPKRAIPFRTVVPFKKTIANVIAPDGTEGQKIEILGLGQQVVVDGTHPETMQPYYWRGGKPGTIKWNELPLITETEARQFVEQAVRLLIDQHGYTVGATRPKDKARAGNGAEGGEDWSCLIENIRVGHELHDSICVLAAKLIASGMSEGAAINFLRGLLQECEAPHDERWRERLEDIPRAVKTASVKYGAGSARKDLGFHVSIDDFYAYMPMHNYLFAPSREPWPSSSVNARIPPIPLFDASGQPVLNKKDEQETISANLWLDQNKPVEQMTWAPGLPMIIEDRLISDGGWIEHKGVSCFNHYRPPVINPGDPTQVGPWLDHAHKVFGDDADHTIRWLAHRVQRPAEKINHALVLGGHQGIGKDTLLEPVKQAVGPWNFHEVSPQHMLGRFNGFLKAVILRVNEARDLGDVDRFAFYDHMKAYRRAPRRASRR